MKSVDEIKYDSYYTPAFVEIEMCTEGVICESVVPGESEGTGEEIWPNLF